MLRNVWTVARYVARPFVLEADDHEYRGSVPHYRGLMEWQSPRKLEQVRKNASLTLSVLCNESDLGVLTILVKLQSHSSKLKVYSLCCTWLPVITTV